MEPIAWSPVLTRGSSGPAEYNSTNPQQWNHLGISCSGNKIIAYELNMCESTVKVHIRNIMQKLKATNRTEAAYKVSNLFSSNGGDLLQR